nr:MAG TPA: hypothetical protein [Caudoviricetes sp.]
MFHPGTSGTNIQLVPGLVPGWKHHITSINHLSGTSGTRKLPKDFIEK